MSLLCALRMNAIPSLTVTYGILASVCLIEIQMLNVANDTLVSREFKNEIYRQKEKQVDYNRGLKLQDT